MKHSVFFAPTRPLLVIIAILTILQSIHASARPPQTTAEALTCAFFVTTYTNDGKPYASGSAFVVEDQGIQWIYTNAHVIDGASKVEFYDNKKQLVLNFGKFACYATGSGNVSMKTDQGKTTNIKFGGDGVRLELKTKRELAFELQDKSFRPEKSLEVVTIGDNGGNKTMEILDGKVTTTTDTIVLTTCQTEHGSSGGALIDKKTLKVIGLNTWGFPAEIKPVDILWSDFNKLNKSAGASIVGAASWIEIPASEFLKGSEYAKRLLDATRLLTLIYITTPTKAGFKVNESDQIALGVTIKDAFDRYAWDTMLRPVAALNKRLAKTENSKMGINSMEVVNIYAKAIGDIRSNYSRLAEETKNKIPPYFRKDLEARGVYAVGDYCHERLGEAEKWFTDKASVGGTMPVGDWLPLPPLSNFAETKK